MISLLFSILLSLVGFHSTPAAVHVGGPGHHMRVTDTQFGPNGG
jgi:hypothetical protein